MLAALPFGIARIEADDRVSYVNPAAEELFGAGGAYLAEGLKHVLPSDSPVFALIDRTRSLAQPVREHAVRLVLPRRGVSFEVDLDVAPLGHQPPGTVPVLLCLRERAILHRLDRQHQQRESARAVGALAAMLAHEVKNPLSGIRGAAQLLEEGASEPDRELARVIRDEVDRIASLITRMEAFGDVPPLPREPVNIHEVLERVRMLAANGFASHVRIVEAYDPSLPPVLGNKDELIQLCLNLVKNAAEAVPETGGEIVLGTAYESGLMVTASDGRQRHQAPIRIAIRDNGPGISDAIRDNLFDPYVTSKASGSGLGLALVAKIVRDLGGAIEYSSDSRGTEFRVFMPAAPVGAKP
ncbi:MAG: nitrogen regulation protein NR(II) [Alphaproteobacteria bacterium]